MKPVNLIGVAPAATTRAADATAAAAAARAAVAAAGSAAPAVRPGAGAVGAARTGAAAASGGGKPPPPPLKRDAADGASSPEALTARARAMLPPSPRRPLRQVEGQKLRERYEAAVAADVKEIDRLTRQPSDVGRPLPTPEDARKLVALRPNEYAGVQRIADMALGPKRTDALRYAIGSRVPEILGGGTPRGTAVLNLGGTPESEMVVYPRGVTRGIALTSNNPAEFMERVWQLRDDFTRAKKDFSDARAAAQATRGESAASQSDVTRADEWARSRLQRVVDLREMLRNTGEPEDSLVVD